MEFYCADWIIKGNILKTLCGHNQMTNRVLTDVCCEFFANLLLEC